VLSVCALQPLTASKSNARVFSILKSRWTFVHLTLRTTGTASARNTLCGIWRRTILNADGNLSKSPHIVTLFRDRLSCKKTSLGERRNTEFRSPYLSSQLHPNDAWRSSQNFFASFLDFLIGSVGINSPCAFLH